MKKGLKGLTILLVTLLCALFLQLNIIASEEIKLGGVWSITGGLAAYGAPARKGAALAVKEINAKGGILGKQINFIVEDGRTEQDVLANATERLISLHKVDFLIGTVESTHTLIVGGIAQANKIIFIDTMGTASYIPERVGEYQFMAIFTDDTQGEVGAVFAYDVLKARTAWLFVDTAQDYCVCLADAFEKAFTSLGGKVLLRDSYTTGDVDLRAQITRLRSLDPQPDILFIPSDGTMAGTVVRQVREMGINLPIVSGDGFDSPTLAEVAGKEYSNNIYFTTHVDLKADIPIVKNFVKAYQDEYNTPPEQASAACGYDTVYLLKDAIERAGTTETEAVRIALGQTKDLSLVTGNLSYLNGLRSPAKEVTIIKVVNGEFKFLQRVSPKLK